MKTTISVNTWVGKVMFHYLQENIKCQGVSNENEVIADCYHILFLNYYMDSYLFDALEALKKDKQIYRHTIKPLINNAQLWLRNYDKRVEVCMGKDYNEKFAEMNFNLDDAFSHELQRLEESVVNALKAKGCTKPELCAKLDVSIMLNEFCNDNLKARIEINRNENPSFKRIEWTSHATLHPILRKIEAVLKYPDVSNDLMVRDRFFKLQRKWLDEVYLADHIGDVNYDETEEATELAGVIREAQLNKAV